MSWLALAAALALAPAAVLLWCCVALADRRDGEDDAP